MDSDYRCSDCLQRRLWVKGFGRSTREFCLETWSGGSVVSGATRSLVERDNNMADGVLVDFVPLGARMVLLLAEVGTEGRLGP